MTKYWALLTGENVRQRKPYYPATQQRNVRIFKVASLPIHRTTAVQRPIVQFLGKGHKLSHQGQEEGEDRQGAHEGKGEEDEPAATVGGEEGEHGVEKATSA